MVRANDALLGVKPDPRASRRAVQQKELLELAVVNDVCSFDLNMIDVMLPRLKQVRKRVFWSVFMLQMIILPRQARDKHRENSKLSTVFSQVMDLDMTKAQPDMYFNMMIVARFGPAFFGQCDPGSVAQVVLDMAVFLHSACEASPDPGTADLTAVQLCFVSANGLLPLTMRKQ
jgi:hypothetical protein